MRKLLIKIFVIIIIALIFETITFNASTYASTMTEYIEQGDSFLAKGSTDDVIDENALKSTSTTIYNILFSIAIVLAVAVGMIIGIQFMLGSVDEKAKIKETLVPYVIGVFVVFAAFGIWKIVVNIGSDITQISTVEANKQIENLKTKWDEYNITGKLLIKIYEFEQENGMMYRQEYKLEQAIKMLTEEEQHIYNECKKNDLLDDTGMKLK